MYTFLENKSLLGILNWGELLLFSFWGKLLLPFSDECGTCHSVTEGKGFLLFWQIFHYYPRK